MKVLVTNWPAVAASGGNVVAKIGKLASDRIQLLAPVEDVAILHGLP